MSDDHDGHSRTFTEEIELAGSQLLQRIRELFAEGNVRRLRVRTPDGGVFLEIPLTAGVVAGGMVTLAAPWIAAIGALAGLAARVKVEIVRESKDNAPPSKDKPDA